jgi:C1A family cysteine protease
MTLASIYRRGFRTIGAIELNLRNYGFGFAEADFSMFLRWKEGFLMEKTRKSFNGCYLPVVLLVLAGFFMTCGMALAQIQSDQVVNQIRPEIRAQLQAVQREIREKGYTFTAGYSPAMEYTIPQLCGLVEPKDWKRFAPFERMEAYLSDPLPTSYDWTKVKGGNTPVRNQGSCGSCWAFGTVGPLEILIGARCGKSEDLSEQYLVSCNENGWSCSGGWFAHDYHQWYIPKSKKETQTGALPEGLFLYKASNVACNGPHNPHSYKINGWNYIAGSNGMPSVDAIKQAIYTYGPVSAAVCVGSKFQVYKSGIFDANETCSGNVNHAVTLVGWRDAQGAEPGYWILKNSWDTWWGESGFMRIKYGTSKVGYAANYIDFTSANCGSPPAAGLDCTSAVPLSPPATINGATSGNSKVSTYNLGPAAKEIGPEKIYLVTTPKTGDLTATLSNQSTNLNVFILSACDPNKALDWGATSAKYVNAPAGNYYIVVDGTDAAGGSFTLQTNLATAMPDLTGSWTKITSYSSGRTVYGTLQVNNIGGANAGTFKVAYYLGSSEGTSSYLGYTTVSAGLKAGQGLILSPSYTSRTSLTGKYLIAMIDSDAKVTESNEGNNRIVSGAITKSRLK